MIYTYKPVQHLNDAEGTTAEVTVKYIVKGCGSCPFAMLSKRRTDGDMGICANTNRHPLLDITITKEMLERKSLPSGCPMKTDGAVVI